MENVILNSLQHIFKLTIIFVKQDKYKDITTFTRKTTVIQNNKILE